MFCTFAFSESRERPPLECAPCAAARPPPSERIEIPPARSTGFPKDQPYEKFPFIVHWPLPRAVLRPTPSGRSVNSRSRFVSKPVRIVKGGAEPALMLTLAFRLRSCWLLHPRLKRRRMSPADGPQSSSMRPVAGRLNAPSVLLSVRPRNTLVNTLIRRQLKRALAGVGRVPGGGGGGGGAPAVMIITPGPIMIGPLGPPVTAKFMFAPMFPECARDRASPSTSTMLANAGSGRVPSIGWFRLLPRIRFSPLVCA